MNMRRIDKLIKKVTSYSESGFEELWPGNADNFITALGVDPEKYKKENYNGVIGYDFIQAMNDIAGEVWGDWDVTTDIQPPITSDEQDEKRVLNTMLGLWRNV